MTKSTGTGRGRPKGARNKRTTAVEKAAAEAAAKIAEVIPQAFAGDSHAYLMTIYKDPAQPIGIRMDAAKAALPFERHRLATVEHTTPPDRPMQSEVTHKLDPASAKIIADLVK